MHQQPYLEPHPPLHARMSEPYLDTKIDRTTSTTAYPARCLHAVPEYCSRDHTPHFLVLIQATSALTGLFPLFWYIQLRDGIYEFVGGLLLWPTREENKITPRWLSGSLVRQGTTSKKMKSWWIRRRECLLNVRNVRSRWVWESGWVAFKPAAQFSDCAQGCDF